MTDIDKEIDRIVNTVIECGTTSFADTESITRATVLGKCKRENVVRIRCLLVHHLYKNGLSIATIGQILGKSQQAIRNKLAMHDGFSKESRIYKIANAQVERRLKETAIDFDKL